MASITNFVLFDLNVLGVSYLLLDSQESNITGTIKLSSREGNQSYTLAVTEYISEIERARAIKECFLFIHNDIKP